MSPLVLLLNVMQLENLCNTVHVAALVKWTLHFYTTFIHTLCRREDKLMWENGRTCYECISLLVHLFLFTHCLQSIQCYWLDKKVQFNVPTNVGRVVYNTCSPQVQQTWMVLHYWTPPQQSTCRSIVHILHHGLKGLSLKSLQLLKETVLN